MSKNAKFAQMQENYGRHNHLKPRTQQCRVCVCCPISVYTGMGLTDVSPGGEWA